MTPSGPPDLSVSFAGIDLKNPIIAASGTFGYGIEFEDIVHLDKLGGFVVKGLSKEPMTGNPPPRLFETAAGMLNAIGLQNIGARAFVDEKLPALREKKNIVVFANVFGYTRPDYERALEILNEGEGIAAYELNVSCPNTAHGGVQFGSDPHLLDEVVSSAKRVARRPLIVKLSPNVTSIAQMAHVAQEAGADAISLVNTFLAMAIDADTRRPRIANVTAGFTNLATATGTPRSLGAHFVVGAAALALDGAHHADVCGHHPHALARVGQASDGAAHRLHDGHEVRWRDRLEARPPSATGPPALGGATTVELFRNKR